MQQDVLDIVNQKIINSERLYEAEKLKFELGESSIFLLNQRERKLLEARTEQIKSFWSIGKLLNDLYYLKQDRTKFFNLSISHFSKRLRATIL